MNVDSGDVKWKSSLWVALDGDGRAVYIYEVVFKQSRACCANICRGARARGAKE